MSHLSDFLEHSITFGLAAPYLFHKINPDQTKKPKIMSDNQLELESTLQNGFNSELD
jgi:hypothetical protein